MTKSKILVFLCSIFFASSLFSSKGYEDKNIHIYKNLDYLNLNNNQKDLIKIILIESKKELHRYYKKQHKSKKELEELFEKDYFDVKKHEEISKNTSIEAIQLEAKILNKIHMVLTPAQREQFSHYLKEWGVE